MAAIVESSDDAIIGKDLDGIVQTWNRGAERLYGHTAAEMRGRSLAVLIPHERSGELAFILEHTRSGRRVEHLETIRRAKDGRLVEVLLTVSPVRDGTGRIIGGATIGRDLTVLRREERTRRASDLRWRAVIESALDGVADGATGPHSTAAGPMRDDGLL
jgi:PAS domain S-box-containing protein